MLDSAKAAPATDPTPLALKDHVVALAPALAGLLVFLPALADKFVYDDQVDVAQVDAVFTPGAWPRLFVTATAKLYRPMKYLAFHIQNALFGWHPGGFHLVGILLHAAICYTLFLLMRQFRISTAGACAAAIWFALHPIHTEAVVWISSQSSLLSALAVVVCLLAYARWRAHRQPGDLALIALAGFTGFFSKEDALMIFPAIAAAEYLLLPRVDKDERMRLQILPVALLVMIAATYVILRQTILGGLSQGSRENGWIGLASTLPVIIARYILQLLFPAVTAVDMPVDYHAGFNLIFWLSLALVAVLLASFLRRGRRAAVWRYSVFWFFLFLAPAMGIIPINQPMADRFLYIPSMAGAFILGAGWDELTAFRPSWRPVLCAALAALFALFSIRCIQDTRVWKNDLTLWTRTIEVNPASYRGYNNLAVIANNHNRPKEALVLVNRALAIKPDYSNAFVAKAYALDRLGHAQEAEALYRRALKDSPDNTVWLFLLADHFARAGRTQDAEAMYDRIFAIRPGYVDARLAAGSLAAQAGDLDKAITNWRIALQVDPDNGIALHNIEVAKRQKAGTK